MLDRLDIRVDIELDDIVDGYSYGYSIFEDCLECVFLVNKGSYFTITFSDNVVDISDTFILGLFEVVYETIGLYGIDSKFKIECSSIVDLKERVLNVLSDKKI